MNSQKESPLPVFGLIFGHIESADGSRAALAFAYTLRPWLASPLVAAGPGSCPRSRGRAIAVVEQPPPVHMQIPSPKCLP